MSGHGTYELVIIVFAQVEHKRGQNSGCHIGERRCALVVAAGISVEVLQS